MAELKTRLRAPAPAAGIRTRLERLDGPRMTIRGLYLLSATLTGAVIYLGVQWPSRAQPRSIATYRPAPAAAAALATVVAQAPPAAPDSLAAGSLIREGLRGVNATREEILLAEQAAPEPAAIRPPATGLAVSAPAAVPATQVATAPPPAPASPAITPLPSPSMVAEAPQAAPADVGAGPAQRSPVQVPNRITIPATVPPSASPTPTRPR